QLQISILDHFICIFYYFLFAVRLDYRYLVRTISWPEIPPCITMTEIETPFRPREKLVEKQKYFQSIHKHTYLKGPFDKITSVVIPLALATSAVYLIGRGIYNMSHGIGKKE
ncbi:Cytochrome c oxidase, partial [Melia azedarach]